MLRSLLDGGAFGLGCHSTQCIGIVEAIETEELAEMITDAWRNLAPAACVSEFDAAAANVST